MFNKELLNSSIFSLLEIVKTEITKAKTAIKGIDVT